MAGWKGLYPNFCTPNWELGMDPKNIYIPTLHLAIWNGHFAWFYSQKAKLQL